MLPCARTLERSTIGRIGGDGACRHSEARDPRRAPSARVLDDAAERIAAAGVEDARADAEAIVADALGVKPEELSVDSADERLRRGRRGDRGEGRAAGSNASRWPTSSAARRSATSRSPSTSACCGRAARPSCWSRSATKLPQGARVHEVGTGSGAIALALMSRASRPADHRLGPLAGGGRSRPRERRAPRPRPRRLGRPTACPTTSRTSTW